MSKRDKTSQQLLDSIRKTKESAQSPAEMTAPGATVQEPASQPSLRRDAKEKIPEEESRRLLSSRRVWPD